MTVIPRDARIAAGNALRFAVLAEINQNFANSGLSVETVASRLGHSPRRIRRMLSGQSQLSLRDIAELSWAMGGGMIKFSLVPRS